MSTCRRMQIFYCLPVRCVLKTDMQISYSLCLRMIFIQLPFVNTYLFFSISLRFPSVYASPYSGDSWLGPYHKPHSLYNSVCMCVHMPEYLIFILIILLLFYFNVYFSYFLLSKILRFRTIQTKLI